MSTVVHEVIIIGAGVAGLAAAQRLRSAGLSSWVVEARERIGGRVWTDRSRGVVELGAEFIHGKNAATWELIRQAGLSAVPWPPEGLADIECHAQANKLLAPQSDLSTKAQNLVHLIEQYEGPEQSVAEFVAGLTPPGDLAAKFALRRLANVENADVTRLSAQAVGRERRLDTAGWGDNFQVTDGYDSIAAFLAQGLILKLNTAVTRIEWDEAGVTLFLADQQKIQARRVIVTVPLGVLQAGTPDFYPALPSEKQYAIQSLAMGHVAKLALWFERAFWSPFAFLNTDGLIPAWWPLYSDQGAVLMGYIGGPAAITLTDLGHDAAIKQGLAEVAGLFGAVADESFVKGQLVDWSGDVWTRGGYSYTPVGADNVRAELAAPVANTLFFAGEATSINGHNATVHGAIESGWRVAEEILAASI